METNNFKYVSGKYVSKSPNFEENLLNSDADIKRMWVDVDSADLFESPVHFLNFDSVIVYFSTVFKYLIDLMFNVCV